MTNTGEIVTKWFYEYSHDVYDFLVYYTGNKDVEELVQEVFIKVSKGLKSYKHNSSPKTWIFSIARNVAIDDVRKRKRRIMHDTSSFDERIGTAERNASQTPEKILLQNEEEQELFQAIQQLKKGFRDVLILRGVKGFSVRETAEILEWKEAKVKTNYHRAKQTLKKLHGWEDS